MVYYSQELVTFNFGAGPPKTIESSKDLIPLLTPLLINSSINRFTIDNQHFNISRELKKRFPMLFFLHFFSNETKG